MINRGKNNNYLIRFHTETKLYSSFQINDRSEGGTCSLIGHYDILCKTCDLIGYIGIFAIWLNGGSYGIIEYPRRE